MSHFCSSHCSCIGCTCGSKFRCLGVSGAIGCEENQSKFRNVYMNEIIWGGGGGGFEAGRMSVGSSPIGTHTG